MKCSMKQESGVCRRQTVETKDMEVEGTSCDDDDDALSLSEAQSGEAHMQYRSVDSSFESDDVSGDHCNDYGEDMLEWDYKNVHWDDDSQSSADSPFVEQVTKGVLHQTLDDTPSRGTSADEDINFDCGSASPDFVDLTNTPSVARAKSSPCADVIDLCETP